MADPACLNLPATPYNYSSPDLPLHFQNPILANWDNTPVDNPTTDAGATLGRVLFYDKRLSANDTVACASCHQQEHGFSDPDRFSTGFEGGLTGRNSMSIVEARFYKPNKFFWDHRADGFEAQALMPIQNAVEMGMTLPGLVAKVAALPEYAPLFAAAFGDATVTSDRIAKAIAQFGRSILSYRSRYDEGMAQVASNLDPFPNFTAQENLGKSIFLDGANQCRKCHMKSGTDLDPNYAIFTQDTPANNGLDAAPDNPDNGIGGVTGNPAENGVFKGPTLRNILLTAPYMHDGRFATIDDVLDFYATGIQPHPNLSRILTLGDGSPRRIVFTTEQREALKAFFATLTDTALVQDPKFMDPFCQPALCPATPVACESSLRSSLALKNSADRSKRRLKWRFDRGTAAAAQADFGDPVGAAPAYRLCVYDQSGNSSTLRLGVSLNGGGTCDGQSCWSAVSDQGWQYRDRSGASGGITQVKMRGGDAGEPSIQVAAAGSALPLPDAVDAQHYFAQDSAVVVQFHSSDPETCWESRLPAAGTKWNETGRFKAMVR